jgi:ribonuclease HI
LGIITAECGFFPSQTGYAKGRSTTENVAVLMAVIETAFLNGEVVVAVYVDFKGAFERISHAKIVSLLLDRAARGGSAARVARVAGWVRGFLRGRRRRVRWRKGESAVGHVAMGAPQGTVLGPCLFKEYLDPLLRLLDKEGIPHLAYADDITIYFRSSSLIAAANVVQRGIDVVEEWCRSENMEISPEKTVATVYGKGVRNSCDIRVGGVPARFSACPRYLGVLLDRELTMKPHAKRVVNNAKRRLRAVRILAGATWKPRSVHIYTLYNGVVESAVFNAAGAWLPRLDAASVASIEALQAEGAALILGVPRRLCSGDVLIHEAGLIPASLVSRREAGFLVCSGRSRAEFSDPLRRSLDLKKASWVTCGVEALRSARVNMWPLEKEERFPIGPGNDIWRHMRSGMLEIRMCEAGLSDLEESHADPRAVVYYTDGAAAYGRGAGAFAKGNSVLGSKGCELDYACCFPVPSVADAFASEKHAIVKALDDFDDLERGKRRMVVWTDAMSVLGSLLAAGVMDRAEERTMRRICKLCSSGIQVQIGFLRSHSGWLGNEVADSFAKYGRQIEEWYPLERTIPMYIAKSRLSCKAVENRGESLRQSGTSRALAKSTGRGRNPILGDSGAFRVNRRTECIYNQLRLGCSTFLHGFRRWQSDGPVICSGCGGVSNCRHFFLECPAFVDQRAKLTRNVKDEADEQHEKAVDRALALGKRPPKAPRWNGLEMSAVGKQPFATMQYISECQVWADRFPGAVPKDPCAPAAFDVRVRPLRSGWNSDVKMKW